MKITCDSCGAKYQVADEKVKNKVFKIRCKRCEHVIVVRGNEHSSDAVAEEHSAAPADDDLDATRQVSVPVRDESVGGSTQWHIVIDGKQVGPSTPEDIAGYLGRGEVTADAFVWREGMGEWAKLSSVDEFQHLFASSQDSEEAVDRGSQSFEQPPSASEDFGGNEDDDVMASNHAPAEDAGLFSAVDAGQHADPRVSSSSQLTGQRNENSVLFSLDALSDDAGVPRDVQNTGGTDGSGLIDISMLGTSGAADSADDMFGGGGGGGGAVRATVGFGAGFRGATFLDFRVRRRRTFLFFGLAATCFLAVTAGAAEAAAAVFPSAETG